MKTKSILVALAILLCCVPPAAAQRDDAERALDLFVAYQGGYFQVVAVSCFQLYSSTGIIVSDFEIGVIDGGLAQSALERSRLLLSVCTTSLENIRTATPIDDQAAQAEIGRLGHLLSKLVIMFDALDDKFIYPSDENSALADKALAELDYAMEQYTDPSPK